MSDQRFPKSARLLNSAEFQRVFAGNIFAADDVLVIKVAANPANQTRLGLSIGKKVGNAVVRNRWKRVIREAFRCQRSELPPGLDLVVRPKKGAVCDFANVHRSIRGLVVRASKRIERQNQEKGD